MSAEPRQDDTTTLASPVAAQLARPEDGPQAGVLVDGTPCSSPYYGSKAEALVAVKSLPPGVRFTIVESSTQAELAELTGFTLQTHEELSEITIVYC